MGSVPQLPIPSHVWIHDALNQLTGTPPIIASEALLMSGHLSAHDGSLSSSKATIKVHIMIKNCWYQDVPSGTKDGIILGLGQPE